MLEEEMLAGGEANRVQTQAQELAREPEVPEKWKRDDGVSSPLLGVAFKVLVALISFSIFCFLEVVLLFATLSASGRDFSGLLGCSFVFFEAAGVVLFLIIVLTAILVLVRTLAAPGRAKGFYRAFRTASFSAILLIFVLSAINWGMLMNVYDLGDPFALFIRNTVCASFALVSFMPVVATWGVKNEERLKNFIDALSKALSCLAIIVGAIAIIVGTFK